MRQLEPHGHTPPGTWDDLTRIGHKRYTTTTGTLTITHRHGMWHVEPFGHNQQAPAAFHLLRDAAAYARLKPNTKPADTNTGRKDN